MIWVLTYQIFVIWLAFKNASWSNPNEEHKIKHWLNGLCHLTAGGIVFLITGSWFLAISLLLITRVVFDTSMNLFRGLEVGYVSPAPDSWIDKKERDLIFFLSSLVFKGKTIIVPDDIEKVAIGFRLVVLITGVVFLFI